MTDDRYEQALSTIDRPSDIHFLILSHSTMFVYCVKHWVFAEQPRGLQNHEGLQGEHRQSQLNQPGAKPGHPTCGCNHTWYTTRTTDVKGFALAPLIAREIHP